MTSFIVPYLLSLPVLVAFDLTWLGVVMKDFYRARIGHLLSGAVGWGAAVGFYLIFVAGLFFFVVYPAVEKNSWHVALLYGALYGFVTYATYDLTNMATLKNWPLSLTIVDILWGSVLGGVLGTVGYLLYAFFNK